MEALLQKLYVELRFVPPEARTPYPRIALGGVVGLYDVVAHAIVVVLVSLVTVKIKLLGGLEREVFYDITLGAALY